MSNAAGFLEPLDQEDRSITLTALDDVREWLGFRRAGGYASALLEEGKAIFKRAKRR